MFDILNKIKSFWDKDPFITFCMICILGLLILSLVQFFTNKKGTWANYYFIPEKESDFTSLVEKNKINKNSKGEIECKRVLEEIFNKPFYKARPDFLRNPVTGGNFNLELDCYNPELRLAVEYNGQQHYKYIPFFHKNQESFLNQKYRDELKRRMCMDNMITLIEVPYHIKNENIKEFVIQELYKKGYIV